MCFQVNSPAAPVGQPCRQRPVSQRAGPLVRPLIFLLLVSPSILAGLSASTSTETANATTKPAAEAAAAAATTATPITTTAAPNSTLIKLGVFMESLCPDTRRFFTRQLVPTQRLIGEIFDLEVVPFGHARLLGHNKMVCQHGPKECEGNRRMACILARSDNQTAVVETLGCLMHLGSVPKDCLTRNLPSVSFDEVETCTAGDESYQLMVLAEKASGRLDYVPHLTIDGKSSEEIQDQAEHHLKSYLCKLYAGSTPPDACKSDQ